GSATACWSVATPRPAASPSAGRPCTRGARAPPTSWTDRRAGPPRSEGRRDPSRRRRSTGPRAPRAEPSRASLLPLGYREHDVSVLRRVGRLHHAVEHLGVGGLVGLEHDQPPEELLLVLGDVLLLEVVLLELHAVVELDDLPLRRLVGHELRHLG